MTERTRPLPTVEEQVTTARRIVGEDSLPPWPESCHKCGKCCTELLVEATLEDVVREPLIAARGLLLDGNGKLEPEDWQWSLTFGKPCPFLTDDIRCGIYATRPAGCAEFIAGGEHCRELRDPS